MRICVVGTGAIGGLMAARLARAGEEVTAVDRGAHLEAIRNAGLKLLWNDGTEYLAEGIEATDRIDELGAQDVVILAVKAYDLETVAPKVPKLVAPETIVVTVQNGIPWWYFHRHGGALEGRRLESLDPRGVLAENVDGDRIVGCVVYPAATVARPGVIRHVEGDRFPIGELDGRETERIKRLHGAFVGAGLRSRILDDVRAEIWLKAWGNLSFNPISALTRSTLEAVCRFPETRKLARTMMAEAQAVAGKLGIRFRHTIEKRIEGAEGVGPHKTSMLQDLERGRSLEVEATIGAVLELGRLTGTPTPSIEAVHACVKLLDRTMLLAGTGTRLEHAAS